MLPAGSRPFPFGIVDGSLTLPDGWTAQAVPFDLSSPSWGVVSPSGQVRLTVFAWRTRDVDFYEDATLGAAEAPLVEMVQVVRYRGLDRREAEARAQADVARASAAGFRPTGRPRTVQRCGHTALELVYRFQPPTSVMRAIRSHSTLGRDDFAHDPDGTAADADGSSRTGPGHRAGDGALHGAVVAAPRTAGGRHGGWQPWPVRVIMINSCDWDPATAGYPTFLVTWDTGVSSYVNGGVFLLDSRPE